MLHFFLFFLVIIIVAISFLRDLNVELRLAIFTLKLIIFGNIEFTCTGWAERDIGLHAF